MEAKCEVWPTRHHSLSLHLRAKSPSPLPLSPPTTGFDFAFDSPSKSEPQLLRVTTGCSPSLPSGYSLHSYRRSIENNRNQEGSGKTLRRKNANENLNQSSSASTPASTPAQMGTIVQAPSPSGYGYYPGSTTASPPPPLSPSYSPSALSEQFPESLDGYGYPLSPVASHFEGLTGKQSPCKLLDTFRDRLEKFPDPETPDIVEFHGHSRTRSDSVLFKTRRARKPPVTATVVHQGTSFEILNPHESLDFARIVSYIEDVDSHHKRDSYLHSSDGSNVIPEDPSEETFENEIIPIEEQAHDDLVGDSPHRCMPSISERLEQRDDESIYSRSTSVRPLSRPLSMVRPWTAHNDTDLGEPGPPIYDDELGYLCHPSPAPAPPLPSTSQNPHPHLDTLDPIHLAALYDIDINRLPLPGKGADNPTAVIYSDHPPLRKRSKIRKEQSRTRNFSPSPTSFSFKPSAAAATASAPLKRLRGMAKNFRRKTFPRPSLS
ncbi:oxidoreductase, short-chain dehydrogenase/reductase family [Aspergillus stella-maris]|uniref:oxidoreductase, short-chain dehydrogenase/reductase family n=1 Tax=Aspergillus stella-maris TaxID=1810926 RepID=UPI003CCCFE29